MSSEDPYWLTDPELYYSKIFQGLENDLLPAVGRGGTLEMSIPLISIQKTGNLVVV